MPNAAATANASHPAKQGHVQSLGVFFDTIIICSATAFIILLVDLYGAGEMDGILLTQDSMAVEVWGWAPYFVAFAIMFFAFSSIIGNYYYGETNIEFINAHKFWMTAYRFAVLGMVMFGTMAILNLIVILVLDKVALKVLDDFSAQHKKRLNPVFKARTIPGLKGVECWEALNSIEI